MIPDWMTQDNADLFAKSRKSRARKRAVLTFLAGMLWYGDKRGVGETIKRSRDNLSDEERDAARDISSDDFSQT